MSEVADSLRKHDVQQITSLVVHSFKLSRGSAKLQQQMLVYAGSVLKNGIPASSYSAAAEPTIATCKKIFMSRRIHLPTTNEGFSEKAFDDENDFEIKRFLGNLKDSALNAERFSSIDLPMLLVGDLINTDEKWLPWVRDAANKRQALRPYISHIAGHAMLGRSSGSPIFDQMFQTVAVNLPRFFASGSNDTEAYVDSFQDVMAGHIDINPADEPAIRNYVAQNNLPVHF